MADSSIDSGSIARHKAAIRRGEPSLPLKCVSRDGLTAYCHSLFDFGCGHGEDVAFSSQWGLDSSGWDPAFAPNADRSAADIVNLGYVLNVIEDIRERGETLQAAWQLCLKMLVVSARITAKGRGKSETEYGDGVVTHIGTFQKYFTQSELREYLESELQAPAFAAAPGVFYIFRDEELRQQFLATRFRRRSATPRKRISELRFEQHRELLEPLMEWVSHRGRMPEPDELSSSCEVAEEFGSIKRAFALIRRVTGNDAWETIRDERADDLLVYLSLANFRKRPRFSRLPIDLQRDVRAFFGAYKRACLKADELLFMAGDSDAIDEACKHSSFGKLLPNALYVHRSSLDQLVPLLRIYEGCARGYLGEIEGANVIKLHRFSGKISYLVYPDFDRDPHPRLLRSLKVSLRSRDFHWYDYSLSENPPILHRKETMLHADHPLFGKFSRLTQQEERHGLLSDSSTIGTQNGWDSRLQERGFTHRGHRLIRRRSAV